MTIAFLVLALLVAPVAAQDTTSGADNPLTILKDEVKMALAEANVPFTDAQERAIILMMEDRRQASEGLFGELLDFSAGPTQGQEADRLRSAIEWMRNEFLSRLQDFLTPEQVAAWSRYQESSRPQASGGGGGAARQGSQTQFVRINNNAFTSEDPTYRTGNRAANAPEVIQRGGVGAFHGNAQFLLRDEALNARNPFASNKPPYQERQSSFDVSGPLIPGKLTTTFDFSQNEAENVDTVRASLPDGVFALGITRPAITRSFDVRNTYQITDGHLLSMNFSYGTNKSENQGVGGFTMPERASTSTGNDWEIELRQFSNVSNRSIYETTFIYAGDHDETTPVTDGIQINVLDAFNIGGAQNLTSNTGRRYEFSNLYTRLGEKLTLKAGMEGVYFKDRSFSQNNFLGTFTFSNLASYLAGTPIQYRVNRGDPLLQSNQLEVSFFIQNDLKLTPQFTLMYGLRYDNQTNVSDHNNFGPRLSFAYGVGQATVIRGGAGIFYQRVSQNVTTAQRRLDGTRQFEIIIDNPSFPDPFQAGTQRETFPSVRVTDPDLVTPINSVAMISFERTFFRNFLVSAQYDINRENHRLRLRNLNAPLPDCVAALPANPSSAQVRSCLPDPTRGNIHSLEATANETAQTFRVNLRQRFSIFNVTGGYTYNHTYSEAGMGNPTIPTNNYDLASDRARVMTPHSFNSTVNAQLPLGVFLTSSMSAVGRRPYNITTGRDDNRDTQVNDRPPGVPRNAGRGPRSLTFNFNISKAFYFSSADNGGTRTNMNLFANMTNAFNKLNLGQPSGVMTSPNFGKSTSATNPREIEVGLRFQF